MNSLPSSRQTRLQLSMIFLVGTLLGVLLFPALSEAISGSFVVVTSPPVPVVAGNHASHVTVCPEGFVATGGGVALYPPENAGLRVVQSAPYVTTLSEPPGAWVASVFNESATDSAYLLYVICFGK